MNARLKKSAVTFFAVASPLRALASKSPRLERYALSKMLCTAVEPIWVAMLLLGVLAVTATAQTGAPLWTNAFSSGPGAFDDRPYGATFDVSGRVFVTGESWGGTSFDSLTIAYTSGGVPIWTNRYNGPGNSNDVAFCVTLDQTGAVFVAGRSRSAATDADWTVIKYSVGGVQEWVNHYDGPGHGSDSAVSIGVDSTGTVYVTGSSYSTSADILTVAYSSLGQVLWERRYHGFGNGNDYPMALRIDSEGGVLVTGTSAGQGGGSDLVTLKYAGGGSALWTNRIGGPDYSSTQSKGIALDSEDNIIVTGACYRDLTQWDYITIKYSKAGTALWTNRFNGAAGGSDSAVAVQCGPADIVYVTGSTQDTDQLSSFGTIAYSRAGLPLWTNFFRASPGGDAHVTAAATDSEGNLFVAGYTTAGASSRDYAVVAYSPAGRALWTNSFNGPGGGDDIINAVSVNAEGDIIVAGYSWSGWTMGGYDWAMIKYSSCLGPAFLSAEITPPNLVLSWTNAGFTLQASFACGGGFTNVSSATSPFTNAMSAAQQFFRLKRQR